MPFREIIYKNRHEAGMLLARHLEVYKNDPKAIVLGIPRGGVEVAYYVAKQLQLPFCTVVARKLYWPGNKDFAFGAIAEGEIVHVPEASQKYLGKISLDEMIQDQKKEIERRVCLAHLYLVGSKQKVYVI